MEFVLSTFLPLALAFIMFSLGLSLTTADFARVVLRPRAFLVGAANGVLLLPVVTFLVVSFFGITGELAVGFMILSACPGGVTSNIISYFSRADVALSISLTALTNLICVLTAPLIVGWGHSYFMGSPALDFSVWRGAMFTFLLVALPTLSGLFVNLNFPSASEWLAKWTAPISAVFFTVIVITTMASNWTLLVENVLTIGVALIALAVSLALVALAVSWIFALSTKEGKTVAIEASIQNPTLGIALAAFLIGGQIGFNAFSLPPAVYGILMFVAIAPFVVWFRRLR